MNAPNLVPPTEEQTMPKKEFQQVALSQVEKTGGLTLSISNFAELEKFAHFMAVSNFVPKHMRNRQADCVAVAMQAFRWEMDPFSVAQKTYFVNDGIGYEAQLVNAVILSRAPLKARPNISWQGEGENLSCTVSAVFKGETEPKVRTAFIRTITTKNSPLWKQDPHQQLAYFTLRAWARLYCPDILMGVYTKEEMEHVRIDPDGNNTIDLNSQEYSHVPDKNPVKPEPETKAAQSQPAPEVEAPKEAFTGKVEIPLDAMQRPMWTPYKNDLIAVLESLTSEQQVMDFQQANGVGSDEMRQYAPTIYKEYTDAAGKKYQSFQKAA